MKRPYLSISIALLLFFIGFLIGISFTKNLDNIIQNPYKLVPHIKDSEVVMSLLYQQKAAEYRALCYQSYNLALRKVENELKKNKTKKDTTLAVVTDLDETVLDNSENQVHLYKNDSSYDPIQFAKWCKLEKAKAVPGSVKFFDSINKLGIQIYYISNRIDSLKITTMNNMRDLGYPQINANHFLFRLKGQDYSKESRRRFVTDSLGKKIVVLLGDNLIDLDKSFDRRGNSSHPTPDERFYKVDSLINIWGDKYIIFPNATYGDWESSIYGFNYYSIPKEDIIREAYLSAW